MSITKTDTKADEATPRPVAVVSARTTREPPLRAARTRGAPLLAACAWTTAIAGCTHLFYHPTDVMYVSNPEALDKIREEFSIVTPDGVRLTAWWLPARAGRETERQTERKTGRGAGKSRGTVVQFHGNAQNLTAHFTSLYWLTDRGYDLLAFDYRGYGISEGKPSPQGVETDALTVIRHALARANDAPVILYGQSLGGAILLHAYSRLEPAEKSRVRALVIESSFYSYKAIARDVLSRTWVTWPLQPLAYVLVSGATSPEDVIESVSPTPLLVLHGDRDPVVPIEFGRRIFELAREPKRFYLIQGGGHLAAPPKALEAEHRAILDFIAD